MTNIVTTHSIPTPINNPEKQPSITHVQNTIDVEKLAEVHYGICRRENAGIDHGTQRAQKPLEDHPELRGKILLIVLREGIWKLEATQQRLSEAWQEGVSVGSIQQVLAENGLGEPAAREIDGGAVQGELFNLEPEPQLFLDLGEEGDKPGEERAGSTESPAAKGIGKDQSPGGQADAGDMGSGSRRNYSPAQRVYLDQWEQGDFNAYAGGLLFTPLLARYDWKKEVWPAVSMIVERGGYVKLEAGRLQVTLRRFKDHEIDHAARHRCEDLNRMQPVTLDRFRFPIHYQVQ